MGKLADALGLAGNGVQSGGRSEALKLKALDDPDLEQLWAELGEI